MPPLIFPCPFCGRRMGVGAELVGRKVRCPHCKQAVTAPATPPTAPPVQTPAPTPVRPLTPTPSEPAPAAAHGDLPVFNLPPPPEPESIFGENTGSDDEVFSSGSGAKRMVPELPLPPRGNEPATVPSLLKPHELDDHPPLGDAPTVITNSNSAAPVEVPPPAEPAPAVPANPWEAMAEPAPASPPLAKALAGNPIPRLEAEARQAEDVAPEPRKPRPDRRPPARAAASTGGGASRVGLFVLAGYALLATGLAVYGLFFKGGADKPAEANPLSTVPDNFGEFPPAERKKSGKAAIPLDGPLPPELRVALGGKLEVGSLEIEPTRVEARPLAIVVERAGGGKPEEDPIPRPAALVLHLRVRNTSPDLTLYPMDPAFTRLAKSGDRPGTGLAVGKQTFWGGAIEWPFGSGFKRVYERAQAADATPLKPGETREYVVFTDTSRRVLDAVRAAKDDLLWRVQVRRGLVAYQGKDVPVTAVVGVEFKPGDVAGLN